MDEKIKKLIEDVKKCKLLGKSLQNKILKEIKLKYECGYDTLLDNADKLEKQGSYEDIFKAYTYLRMMLHTRKQLESCDNK